MFFLLFSITEGEHCRSAILWLGLMALTIGLVIGVFGQKVLGQFGPSTLPPAPAGDPRFQVPLPPPPPGSTTMPPSVPSAVREPAPFPLQTATGPDVVPPQIPAPAGFSKQETQQVSATNATVTLPPGTPSLPPNAAPYSPNGPRTYVPNGVQPPLVGALDLAVPGNDARPGRNDSTVSTEWIGPTQVKVGQPITCKIQVKNSGSVAVRDVVVRHRLCDGVQHRGSEPPATVEVRQLSWNIGTLEAGATKCIELQLLAQARGPLNCQATVTFTSQSSLQVQVREPMLEIKVKGPEKVVIGEPVTFLIQLSNPGDAATEAVHVKATLPEGLRHPKLETVKGRSLEMNAAPLQPKETRILQLVCQAQGSGVQQTSFVASADSDLKSNDDVRVEILQPKLELTVAGPKLRYIDRHAAYTLKVANPGSAPAMGVTLTEVVPAGFKFQNATGAGRFDENTAHRHLGPGRRDAWPEPRAVARTGAHAGRRPQACRPGRLGTRLQDGSGNAHPRRRDFVRRGGHRQSG